MGVSIFKFKFIYEFHVAFVELYSGDSTLRFSYNHKTSNA